MTTMKAALNHLAPIFGKEVTNLGYRYKRVMAQGLIKSVRGTGAPDATARDMAMFIIGMMSTFKDKDAGVVAEVYKDLKNSEGETLLDMLEAGISRPATLLERHPQGALHVHAYTEQAWIIGPKGLPLDLYGAPRPDDGRSVMAQVLPFTSLQRLHDILAIPTVRSPGRPRLDKTRAPVKRRAKPGMKVVVLRTARLDEALEFFTGLGLSFQREQHGAGPVHYACEAGGRVFELYPPMKGGLEGLQVME